MQTDEELFDDFKQFNDELIAKSENSVNMMTHIFKHPQLVSFVACDICNANFGATIFCNVCNKDQFQLCKNFHAPHISSANVGSITTDVVSFVEIKTATRNNLSVVSGSVKFL